MGLSHGKSVYVHKSNRLNFDLYTKLRKFLDISPYLPWPNWILYKIVLQTGMIFSEFLPNCLCCQNLTTDWTQTLILGAQLFTLYAFHPYLPPPYDSSMVHEFSVSFNQKNLVQVWKTAVLRNKSPVMQYLFMSEATKALCPTHIICQETMRGLFFISKIISKIPK